MNAFQLYVILKLDDLHELAKCAAMPALTFVVVCIAAMAWGWSKFGDAKEKLIFETPAKVLRRVSVGMLLLVLIVPVVTPTTKQAAVIWAVPQILESRAVQKDLPELYDLAVDWAKNQLTPANPATPVEKKQ